MPGSETAPEYTDHNNNNNENVIIGTASSLDIITISVFREIFG